MCIKGDQQASNRQYMIRNMQSVTYQMSYECKYNIYIYIYIYVYLSRVAHCLLLLDCLVEKGRNRVVTLLEAGVDDTSGFVKHGLNLQGGCFKGLADLIWHYQKAIGNRR